ncbi:MAG: CoA transferase [Armatimonadetes bacterium]|nr:CoA transferase [Armatimonadota bacterium]
MTAQGPLAGLRVLDFSRLLPGPFCSLILADLGADVIKVEDLASGDYLRWMPPLAGEVNVGFAWLNRGKRSVCLQLRHPDGRVAARRLASGADILIESFRPGVMDSMGLGYDTLAVPNPRLIYSSITGYGQSGPLSQRAGHDINYLARSGAASVTGTRDGTPVPSGLQVADLGGGALLAAVGILAALNQRARTGRGARVDTSMTDGAMALLALQGAEALFTGASPAPGGGLLSGSVPCYRYYRCADGQFVAVGALEPKFWERLCAALELPELCGDGLAQGPRRAEVEAALEARFASRPRAEWLAVLEAVDCCVDPVLGLAEAFDSPHAHARGMRVEIPHGAETLVQAGNPVRVNGWQPTPSSAPERGSHTREVLREAGYSEEEVDGLLGEQVVA